MVLRSGPTCYRGNRIHLPEAHKKAENISRFYDKQALNSRNLMDKDAYLGMVGSKNDPATECKPNENKDHTGDKSKKIRCRHSQCYHENLTKKDVIIINLLD